MFSNDKQFLVIYPKNKKPVHFSYLCFLQQIGEDGEPVRRERLQFQSDDGQGQRGALELPKLVAGHTVLHLPGPQRCLEARGCLLTPRSCGKQTGVCCRIPADAGAGPDGRNEVRVAGDEQGVELDQSEQRNKQEERDQNFSIMMSLLSQCAFIAHPLPLQLHNIKYTSASDVQPCISDSHLSL